jgi:hypothetical protein
MSDLYEMEFKEDSSKLIGGISLGERVYMYVHKGSDIKDLLEIVNR